MDSPGPPITITPIADGMRIAFVQPFHMDTSDVEDELQTVIAKKPRHVEVDLGAVQHLSTIGLGVLISLNHRIHQYGGAVRIVKVRKNTLGVLKTTKLDHVLEIAPDGIID